MSIGNAAASNALDDTGPFAPTPRQRERLVCGGVSHPGKVRLNNEDHFLIAKLAKSMKVLQTNLDHLKPTRFSDEDGYLLVVADGMGGAAAGERASALAIESIEQFTLNTLKWFFHLGGKGESVLLDELRQAIESADRSIFREAQVDYHLSGMGTTVTLGYCVGADLYIVHAGDSRGYLYREGRLDQVTCDHTLVQLLVDNGMLTAEGARVHARRNVVTNVVGGPQAGVHSEIHKIRLRDGDVVLLCSDGLTEALTDDQIAEVMRQPGTPQEVASRLLERSLEHGAPDNVTVIVARFDQRGGADETDRSEAGSGDRETSEPLDDSIPGN